MGALYLMAAGMEPRAVDIKTITPAMNSARVRLSGQVTADARIIKERGTPAYVSFRVDDNSGEITVAARDSCARAIVAQGITPKKGDRVDVTGVVNIRNADSRRIFIESPAHLVILSRPETQRATNSAVDMK
jgi:DNA/RNA endonuclease YhcR with UshA esterase domain